MINVCARCVCAQKHPIDNLCDIVLGIHLPSLVGLGIHSCISWILWIFLIEFSNVPEMRGVWYVTMEVIDQTHRSMALSDWLDLLLRLLYIDMCFEAIVVNQHFTYSRRFDR